MAAKVPVQVIIAIIKAVPDAIRAIGDLFRKRRR